MCKLLLILLFSPLFSLAQSPMYKLLSKVVPSGPPFIDADSTAYVTKVANNGGSLSSSEKSWAGQLIRAKKADNTWNKAYAIYPLLGSSEAAAKVNLRDTANYELSFTGSPTINSGGVHWNGTTQYADSHFTTDLFLTDSCAVSYYSIDNISQAGIPMGGLDMDIELYLGDWYSFNLTGGGNYAMATPSSIAGFFTNTRILTTSFKIYRNASLLNTETATSTTGGGYKIYLGARAGLANAAGFFSTVGCGYAEITKGLGATDVTATNTNVQSFITSAGR